MKEIQSDVNVQDAKAIRRISKDMPPEEIVQDLADLFKVLGDPTRIKILFALEKEALCVGDIAYLLGMSHSAISHQLRLLKQYRLLRARRDGKQIYYSLHDHHINDLFASGVEHVQEIFG